MTAGKSDYSSVTEVPGNLVSREAMDMAVTRHAFGAGLCSAKAVLDVACGPGAGLGFLSAHARWLVGGDYTDILLRQALGHYGSRVPLVRLDATYLPFRRASFDVVILFEAIYFLPNVNAFLESCRNVLTPGGLVLVVTVNPDWKAFNPSPFATKYWTAEELDCLFRAHLFSPELYAGFPAQHDSLRGRVMINLKRAAVKLNVIPKTMKGKEMLKRVAFGKLEAFPAEISPESGTCQPPVRLVDVRAAARFKVLYAAARREEW